MRIAFKYGNDAIHVSEVSGVSFIDNSIVFGEYSCDVPVEQISALKEEMLATGTLDISMYESRRIY